MRQNADVHSFPVSEVIPSKLHAAGALMKVLSLLNYKNPLLACSSSKITAATAKKLRTGGHVLDQPFTDMHPRQ